MDQEEYDRLKKRIEISYRKHSGTSEGAEDCVQGVFTKWLERGNKKGQLVDFAVIDYLRETLATGRKGSGSYERKRALANAGEYVDGVDASNAGYCFDGFDFSSLADLLPQVERVVFLLYGRWGLNEVEIGDILGISGSRVSQRLQRIQSRLSARIEETQPRVPSSRERKKKGLLSEETKRGSGLECEPSQRVERKEPKS